MPKADSRGFLFTGADRLLSSYERARKILPSERKILRHLTRDNRRQEVRLDRLDILTDTRLNQLAETIRVYRERGEDAARTVVLSGRGKTTMDQIRSLLAEFEDEEDALLRERIHRRNRNLANVIFGTSSGMALGLISLVFASRQQHRLKTEQELNKQRNQELQIMQEFVERAPMGILMLDRALRQIQVSQCWLDDVGLTRELVVGKSYYETFPNLPQNWLEAHRKAFAGESLSGHDEVYFTPDDMEHSVNWRMVPWGDGGETTGGIIIYFEDITREKRAEASARRHELQYGALFENMPDALAYCRIIGEREHPKDFTLLALNPAFASLIGTPLAAGRKASDLFPDLDSTLIGLYSRVSRTGRAGNT